jgi:hypothetical protein
MITKWSLLLAVSWSRIISLLISRGLGQFGQRMNRGTFHTGSGGRLFTLTSVLALLVASMLSAAPSLHERIHSTTASGHECAVTIFASGKCEHSTCDSPSAVPHPAPPAIAFPPHQFHCITPALEFSLLEHAPPANS